MNGNLEINLLLEEYQNHINELSREKIYLKAYISQLEKQLSDIDNEVQDTSDKSNK